MHLGLQTMNVDHLAENADWMPIDFHGHGVGKFDFMAIPELSLDSVERSLRDEQVQSILTLYLPQQHFDAFLSLVDVFAAGRASGRYRYIVGLALEGPVLASHGGTPKMGVWMPNKGQWKALASRGSSGLRYIVLSPDGHWNHDGGEGDDASAPDMAWVVECLLDGGVLPAFGHMRKDAPQECGARIRDLLKVVERANKGPIVTDHLYNDMPLNFRHAWRTASARMCRAAELRGHSVHRWNSDNIVEEVGPVPGAILDGARRGLIKVCLNFDGEHVDLAISTRTVEVMGADKFLLMTDRIQSRRLGGHTLRKRNDSSLLYQEGGIVAGGSQTPVQQIQNLRLWGVPESDIRQVAFENAARLLGIERQPAPALDLAAHAVGA